SGAIEAVISYLTIKNNTSSKEITLPVQVWDKIYDPEIPKLNLIDPSTPSAKKTEQIPIQKISTVMSNSFAFGGANTSLILGL
ncbi:MAG: 3-oxoacyl-ACP synthase, partial [Spirochaetia bacterium]|nr:3-oxoacyl-ACP synthase [Spirochaetia bacterium]